MSSRHSPSGVTSARVLVPTRRQRTEVQVGDGGGLWSSVLGDVAPVTGPRRAVTRCDRACTNAQRPNTPQVLRYPDRCSLSATMAVALSSSPPFVRNVSRPRRSCASAIAHTPENLLPYISLLRERSSRRAPSIANPIEASSWSKHLRFRDLPHKVAQSARFA